MLSDPTARELRELRREIAQLRADYATTPGAAARRHAGAARRPGWGAAGERIIGRAAAARRRATRPGFRGTVRARAGPHPRHPVASPRPARPPPCRGHAAEPAGTEPIRTAAAVPRAAGADPAPAARCPDTAGGHAHTPPAPEPDTGRPTPFHRPARRPPPALDEPSSPDPTTAVLPTTPATATASTTELPATPAADSTTALPATPATDSTAALPATPTADTTAALTATPASDSTAALPATPAADTTTALPVTDASATDRTTALTTVPAPRAPQPRTGPSAAPRSREPRTARAHTPAAPAHPDHQPAPERCPTRSPTRLPRSPDRQRFGQVTPAGKVLGPAARRTAPSSVEPATSALAAMLAEVLKVDNVAVDGHFFDDLGADSMLMAQFCARVRKHPELPTVSIKDIYRHPSITALVTALAPPTPERQRPAAAGGVAAGLAAVLAEVLKVEKVAVDGHFFDDLGADSMLMAQFCARVRKHPELPTVSIKDIYRHPTIAALAGAFGGSTDDSAPIDGRQPVLVRAGRGRTGTAGPGQPRRCPGASRGSTSAGCCSCCTCSASRCC